MIRTIFALITGLILSFSVHANQDWTTYNYTHISTDTDTDWKAVMLHYFDSPVECTVYAKKGEAKNYIPQIAPGEKVYRLDKNGCGRVTTSYGERWVYLQAGTFYPTYMTVFLLEGGTPKPAFMQGYTTPTITCQSGESFSGGSCYK